MYNITLTGSKREGFSIRVTRGEEILLITRDATLAGAMRAINDAIQEHQ